MIIGGDEIMLQAGLTPRIVRELISALPDEFNIDVAEPRDSRYKTMESYAEHSPPKPVEAEDSFMPVAYEIGRGERHRRATDVRKPKGLRRIYEGASKAAHNLSPGRLLRKRRGKTSAELEATEETASETAETASETETTIEVGGDIAETDASSVVDESVSGFDSDGSDDVENLHDFGV